MSETTSTTDEFKRLTLEILFYSGPRGILAGLVHDLVGILESAADFRIDPQAAIEIGETHSSKGLAISPTQAILCAGEELRTSLFLRGLHDAISETLETKANAPIRVLYAGCGPFATLAAPLMAIFPPEKVRFTLLDLHPVSIESAKSVVRQLGLERSVEAYITADACHYAIPTDALPDIILSETMSTALETEPQVSILRHLLSQAPNALVVPECVQVDAYLVDTSQEPDRIVAESERSPNAESPDLISLGPVFTLSAETIHSWSSISGNQLPAALIQFPRPPTPDYRPFLFTTIRTRGEHLLRTHDCNLTGIREILNAGDLSVEPSIQFRYQLGADPRLIAKVVS